MTGRILDAGLRLPPVLFALVILLGTFALIGAAVAGLVLVLR